MVLEKWSATMVNSYAQQCTLLHAFHPQIKDRASVGGVGSGSQHMVMIPVQVKEPEL